ncbi:MAG: flagellar hook capping FlgD N-terminal domain-containing protein [Baekduia sp.]
MPVSASQYLNVNAAGLNPVSTAKSTLDKDGFLKLLTAQMRNQDPQSSQDPSEQFGTMMQLTMVEQLTNLSATGAQQNLTGMIGKTVVWKGTDGSVNTGVLESVQISGSNSTATVGGKAGVTAAQISEIR